MKLTFQDIVALKPCCPAEIYLSRDWKGTLLDIMVREDIPAKHRIWVATKVLDDKALRLFAVWCAREALKRIEDPDQRSVEACNVAERYANGEATKKELRSAADAAFAAAANAANAVAAYAVAAYAANAVAAYAAAAYAADAARAFAAAAYAAAAYAAAAAAAEREKQVKHLIEMIKGLEVVA